MMVRNPFRPWWIHVWRNTPFDRFVEAFSAEIAGTNFGGDRRLRWAARRACKRLRERCQLHARTCHELKTDNERLQLRLAEVERHRDLIAEVQANLALELRTTQGRLEDAQHGEACAVEQHVKERELRLAAERERDELRDQHAERDENLTVMLDQLTAAQQENARLMEELENLADCTGAVAERFRYVRTDTAEARAHNGVMQALGKAVRQARAALSDCEEKHDG